MSSFLFPLEREKYSEVRNIRLLLEMLGQDARKEERIKRNPFKLIAKKSYGYISNVVAQCRHCNARLKFQGHATETDHYNDDSAP